MTDAEEFEHLLDLPNVIGTAVSPDGTVQAYVSHKPPASELAEQDIVARNVPTEHETDVVDVGMGEQRDGFTPELLDPDNPPIESFGDRHTKHRPVRAGVSEININSTAATAGHYPVKVTDTSKANWGPGVSEGDLVRISNNHCYARENAADFGERVIQPSEYDGGSADDTTGRLVGYLPLEDGVRADIAARSSTPEMDTDRSHNVPDEWPTSIRRDPPEVGETLVKTGRTTGVTEGDVIAVGASVRVSYDVGTVTLRDQILTDAMSEGGDSGSSTFDTDERLLGLLFAGSSRVTVHSMVANAETDFGVQYMSEAPDSNNHQPEETFENFVEGLLNDEYGEENVFRQFIFSTGKRADFVVVDVAHDQLLCYELENDKGSLWTSGQGQACGYAANATLDLNDEDSRLYADVAELVDSPKNLTTQAVLCFPQGHINDDERPVYDQQGIRLWEVDTPDDVDLSGV